MSLRQSSGYKAFLVLASLACVGGAGFLAYKTFFEKGGSAAGLQAAEQAYKRGEQLLPTDPKEAKVKFDEAALTAENARKKLDDEKKAGMAEKDANKLEGLLLWLEAKAVRDKAYAQGKIDGTELPETTDTSTGERYRNFMNIKDAEPLSKAVAALRKANELVTDNPDLIKDAMRVELSLPNIDWKFAEPVCKNALKLSDNKDARAHYFLAKYHFEQPEMGSGGTWVATPADRRDGGRITADAKPHLKAARENKAPVWRVNHLEADIAAWELTEAKRGGPSNKPAVAKASRELEELLFGKDGKPGMLDQAARGMGFEPLSTVDARGIFDVSGIAMKFATEADGEAVDKAGRVTRVADAMIASCDKLAGSKYGEPYLEEAGEVVAVLLDTAQPFVTTTNADAWRKLKDSAQAFLKKYPKAEGRPNTTLLLANIIRRDAGVRGADVPKLTEQSIATLQSGLEAAQKANSSPELQANFHAALAEMKLVSNKPLAEAEKHISKLRELDSSAARAVTNFLDGVVSMRLGKLDRARKLLESVTTDREFKNTQLAARAVYLLAPIAMSTGDPDAAAGYYGQLADAYRQTRTLTPPEQVWANESAASKEEAIAKQAVCLVAAGLKKVTEEMKKLPPGTPAPVELVSSVADPVARLIKELPDKTAANRTARLALAQLLANAGYWPDADQQIARLATDYPDSADLLRIQVARALVPAKGQKEPDAEAKKKAEGLINSFIAANPGSQSGKLFRAQWLLANKRSKEAVEYLKDEKNFPRQEEVKRVLANALAAAGQREEARRVLGVDPLDPAVEILIMQEAIKKMTDEEQKELLNRFEQSGITRLLNASRMMADGKFEAAATDFNASLEYAALQRAATSLLQRALVGFAGQDPKRAADKTAEYIAERPDLAGLYVPAALAALYLDEVGEPGDAWGTRRTMYAALNKWEQLTVKSQPAPRPEVGLTKVQFHMLAGNPLLARQEAIRVNGQFPNHLPTLQFLAENYIVGADPNLAEAKRYLERLQSEADSADPTPELLHGAWLEASQDLDGAAKHYESLTTRYAAINAPYARRVVVAQAQNKPGEALLWSNKWLEKFPNDPAAALNLIGVLAAGEETRADAVKKADEYVARQLEALEGQLKAAKTELKPEDADTYRKITRAKAQLQTSGTFFQAKVFAEAKKRVEVVLKELPDSPAALLMAGDIALTEKDWNRAEEVYRKRLDTQPKEEKRDFVAANNLAWLLVTHKDDPKKALELVTEVRKAPGGKPFSGQRLPPDFLDTIGQVYVKLNDRAKFTDMQKLFEDATQRYKSDPRMFLFLGQAHAGLSDDEKAKDNLRRAVQLAVEPSNKVIRDDQKAETKKKAEEALAKIAQK